MYTIFEMDDEKRPKMYDLTLGHKESLEEAIKFANEQFFYSQKKVNVYVALTSEYEDGNYNIVNACLKSDYKGWRLHEKNQAVDYNKYSLNELIEMFEPEKNEDDEYLSEEQYHVWNQIINADDFTEYLNNYVNDYKGIHYHDYYIELA